MTIAYKKFIGRDFVKAWQFYEGILHHTLRKSSVAMCFIIQKMKNKNRFSSKVAYIFAKFLRTGCHYVAVITKAQLKFFF